MNRSENRTYQLSQLKLLEYFDSYCEQHRLKYFLVFGTLLGAVRHQGFIPWDADVDVAMYRSDYEQLKEYMIQELDQDLFFQSFETEPNHISPHAILKIKGTHIYYNSKTTFRYNCENNGIYIDIFPIDNVLSDKSKQMIQVKCVSRIRRLVSLKTAPVYSETSFIKKFGKYVCSSALSIVPFRKLHSIADSVMKKYENEKTELVAILTDPQVFNKQLYQREVFGNGKRIPFEGREFMVPEKPEQFLTVRYGDYLILPQEDSRWSYVDNTLESVDYGNTDFLKEK